MSGPAAWVERAERFVTRDLWQGEAGRSAPARAVRTGLQLAVLVAQGFANDQLLLRASALTYFTLLSLIPLIAIAFAMVGPLGVSEDLARVIVDQIAAGSPEAGEKILEILEGANFARLGVLGAGVLFVTSVLAISSVERALNAIWGVRRQRSWMRRFPDYLAVLVIAPLMLGVAMSLNTTLQSPRLVERLQDFPAFASLYRLGLRQAPFVFLWLGFSFLYWFLPNTQVRLRSALLGGFVAALLFGLAQRFYLGFQVGVARSNAVFGTFAALPLLLIWIYLSWAIVLLGAEVAFAWQHLAFYRRQRRGEEPGPAAREALGLAIAVRAARAFREGRSLHVDELSEELDISLRSVRDILATLEQAGILAARGDPERDGYQLGRAADSIRLSEVWEALRGGRAPALDATPEGRSLARLLAELERRQAEVLGPLTLADLAAEPAALPVDPLGSRG